MSALATAYTIPVKPYDGEYSWKPGSRFSIPADTAAQRLLAIQEADGHVAPERVVEDARPADAPLHRAFEWDDGAAAGRYRLGQALHLMRSLTVTVMLERDERTEGVPVRAFVPIVQHSALDDGQSSDGDEGVPPPRVYVPIHNAMGDKDYRGQVLTQAARELGWWRRKYDHLTELADLFAVVDKHLGVAG